MARLEIEIKGPSGSAASSTSATGSRSPEQDGQRTIAAAKRVADEQRRIAERAAAADRFIAQQRENYANKVGAAQIAAVRRSEATQQRATEKAARDAEQSASRQAAAAKRVADETVKATERAAAAQERAIRRVAAAEEAAAIRRRQTIGRGIGAAGAGLGAAVSGVANATGNFVQSAGSSITGALGDNLIGGGLFRAAGGVATSAVRFGVDVGGSIVKGIATAIPVAGPVLGATLGAALSITGAVGGAVTSAVGEIAGFVGDKLGTALKVSVAAAVGVAGVGIAKALNVEQLTPAFEKLAKVTGDDVTSALEKLRNATDGTISDLYLMKGANTAAALGAAQSVNQFGELANIARRLGQTVGVDATFALESMSLGIGRLSPRILDNIGLQISLDDVNKRYAEGLGITADKLTTAQQRQAVLNEVLAQAKSRLEGVSDQNTQKRFDQLKSSIENTAVSIGKSLLPAFNSLLRIIQPTAAAVGQFFDNNKEEIANRIAAAVGNLSVNLSDLNAIVGEMRLSEALELAALEGEKFWNNFVAFGEKAANQIEALLVNAVRDATEATVGLAGKALGGLAGLTPAGATANLFGADLSGTFESSGRELGRSAFRSSEGVRRDTRLANRAVDQRASDANSPINDRINTILDRIRQRVDGVSSRPSSSPSVVPPIVPIQPSPIVTVGSSNVSIAGAGSPSTVTGNAGGGAALAAQLQALALLPPDVIPQISVLLERVGGTKDSFEKAEKNLTELADQLGDSSLVDEIIGARRRSLDDDRAKIDSLESLVQQTRTRDEQLFQQRLQLIETEQQQAKKIKEEFDKAGAAVVQGFGQQLNGIGQQVSSRQSQLEGISGGFEADDGVPVKFKRAAKKARKQANRERKAALTSASAGLSTDELSANGGALAKQILGDQASKEVNAGGQAQAALADALAQLNDLAAERTNKEEQLADEIAKQTEALDAKEEKNLELQQKVIDQIKAVTEIANDTKSQLEKLEKVLDSIARR